MGWGEEGREERKERETDRQTDRLYKRSKWGMQWQEERAQAGAGSLYWGHQLWP